MVKHTKTTRILLVGITAAAILLSGCARKTPEKLIADIQTAMQQQDAATAIVKMEQFLEKYPQDQRAVFVQKGIGDIYAQQGQFQRAIQEYQKVIDKYPVNSPANKETKFAIAGCYANMTTWEKARDIWEKMAIDTSEPLASIYARMNLGKSYSETKEWDKSEAVYKSIISSVPQLKALPKQKSEQIAVDATMELAMMYYFSGKSPKAIETLQGLQGKYPGNEWAQGIGIWTNVQIGDIYRKDKNEKKAMESYMKAISTYAKITADKTVADKSAWATMKMGEVYQMYIKDTAKSMQLFQSVLSQYSTSQWTKFAKAAIARQNKMSQDTAKPAVQAPAKEAPKTPDVKAEKKK